MTKFSSGYLHNHRTAAPCGAAFRTFIRPIWTIGDRYGLRLGADYMTLNRMDSVLVVALDMILTVTGHFAVRLFSLGRWLAEPLGSDEGRIYGAAGGLSYVREGKRVITHTGQLFAGIAFFIALVGLGILYAVAA